MKKRIQYLVKQFNLSDIEDGVAVESEDKKHEISQSENFLFYQIYSKLLDKNIGEKNILNEIITIKTGSGASEKELEKLEDILENGVTFNGNKYVFLDCSISGSQHKQVRQYFIKEDLYKSVIETLTLNKEVDKTVTAKFLTAIALMTTSCNLVDVDMEKLNICIIPDLEFEIHNQHIIYNKKHELTEQEQEELQRYYDYKEQEEEYNDKLKVAKDKAKNEEVDKRSKGNRKIERTFNQLGEEGLRPKLEEVENPVSRVHVSDIYKSIPCWTREQCEPVPERIDIPVSRITTGIDFIEDKNGTIPLNFADGTGLIDTSLAQIIAEGMEQEKYCEGYQIRLPYVKTFCPVIPLKQYFKDNEVEYIIDIFNKPIKASDIDLLLTESCFKAKLNHIDDNTKKWLFESIDEYKNLLHKYDYDKLGIANYVHKPVSEYTKITYQMLLALDIDELKEFAKDEANMLIRVSKIYRGDRVNWDDIKYILAFLNLLKDESAKSAATAAEDEEEDEDEIEDIILIEETEEDNEDEEQDIDTNEGWEDIAIQAIRLNQEMVFDPHIRKKIFNRIEQMINEMRLGKFYMLCNYYYATCHIPTLLDWAVNRDVEHLKKIVPNNVAFMGNTEGLFVAMRNPVTSYMEVAKINIQQDINKYTKHLKNIVQFGAGDFMPRMNMDYDGDKICLFSTNIEYKKGTLDKYVIDSPCQFNPFDKITAKPKEFNKDAVIDFIINSDDKTGSITTMATQVSNRALAEGNFEKYKYEIMYGKYLQGLQIDASKSQLVVDIADAFKWNYNKKPQFLYFKYGGKEWAYDNDYLSPLDELAFDILDKLKKVTIDKSNKVTKERKNNNLIGNTIALLKNDNLEPSIIKEYEEKLRDEFLEFREQFKAISKKYKIDRYSNSDENRELRKQRREEYSNLFKRTREKVYKICDKPSLIAHIAVNYAYQYSKENSKENKDLRWEDNYSFAWVFAEGLLYNLWLNQNKNKIDIVKSDVTCNYDFSMLDRYYITEYDNRVYAQEEIKEIANITVPESLYKRNIPDSIEVQDVLCMGLDKDKTTKDIENRLFQGGIYNLVLFNNYLQLWDKEGKIIGIPKDELKDYKQFTVTDIKNKKQRSFLVDGIAK